MAKFSKRELIERGFAPSAARAKLLIPFCPNLCCKAEEFECLPAEIQAKYEPEPERHGAVLIHNLKK